MKNRMLWMVLFVVFFQNSHIQAEKISVKVDGHRIQKTAAYLASDEFLGRKPNTPEFFRLQDWIVEQYRSWGLEPAGEQGYYQSVPISREYTVNYGTPRMIIDGREFFAHYEDFVLDPRSTAGVTMQKPVVFVGYGISAPEKGLDEYANVEVKGKFVLVLNGNPVEFKLPRPMLARRDTAMQSPEPFDAERWTQEAKDSTKIMVAYHKGAAGIIFYNPEVDAPGSRRFFWQPEIKPFTRHFIVISRVSQELFRWLMWTDPQMSSRGFRNWLNVLRSDIKKGKLRSFTLTRSVKIISFEKTLYKGAAFKDSLCRNIIAKISGSDPELKNEYVVIGAHLDHLGVSAGQVYNGAEDNASGSAVVMEVARLMKELHLQPKRTIVFCLWTGEELGLLGSRYWVDHPTAGISLDRVVSYFNLDMVGIGEELNAPGALNFPEIWEVICKDQDEEIMRIVKPREGGPGGSDHSAFIELGIEALALMTSDEEGHPDYHDTGDDAHKLEPAILSKAAQFVLQGAYNLANETEQPLLIADRQNLYDALSWNITVLNPELKARDGWTRLEATNPKELADILIKKVQELKQSQQQGDEWRLMRRRFGVTPRSIGLLGAATFHYDVDWLRAAKEILGFGRLDVASDDGHWFKDGVTPEGLAALSTLRKENIALHLIKPSRKTFQEVLEKISKPFLVTGFYDFDDSLFSKIIERSVLIGVDFNPADVSACVEQLISLREKLGNSDRLILNVTHLHQLDKGKRELYRQLLQRGWSKKEIYAIGGASIGRRGNGNLDSLPGGLPPWQGR